MADELVQAACLRALEKCDQFQPGTQLSRWAYTILSSIWKNELRSRRVRIGEQERFGVLEHRAGFRE
jgi:RNA polymerase sigma-70 factor (ECF subfamily)